MSLKRRYTTARWAALQWFHDHDGGNGREAVMGRPVPSRRMRSQMIAEGMLVWVEGTLRAHPKLILTILGESVLRSKMRHLNVRARPERQSGSRRRRNKSPEPPTASGPGSGGPTT